MTEVVANIETEEKLVENDSLDSFDFSAYGKRVVNSTIKPIRRRVVPFVRPHRNGKNVYFCYCHGHGPEEYLGNAELIRTAVREYRERHRAGGAE